MLNIYIKLNLLKTKSLITLHSRHNDCNDERKIQYGLKIFLSHKADQRSGYRCIVVSFVLNVSRVLGSSLVKDQILNGFFQ